MVKILSAVVAVIAVATGVFFGYQFYIGHRVASEVDAAFERLHASGHKASHGKVSFDLLSRTVTVADIAFESAAQPPVSVKIASFSASGAGQPDPTRFSADAIEAADIEVSGGMAAPTGWHVSYKAPRITVKAYSGPAALDPPAASSSALELYRFALAQFARFSASSISAPA